MLAGSLWRAQALAIKEAPFSMRRDGVRAPLLRRLVVVGQPHLHATRVLAAHCGSCVVPAAPVPSELRGHIDERADQSATESAAETVVTAATVVGTAPSTAAPSSHRAAHRMLLCERRQTHDARAPPER